MVEACGVGAVLIQLGTVTVPRVYKRGRLHRSRRIVRGVNRDTGAVNAHLIKQGTHSCKLGIGGEKSPDAKA